MTQKIFGLVTVCGDVSSHISWFKNEILARLLIFSDEYLYKYGIN